MSLQTLGMGPLDGRVTSSLEMPFELQMNVGGLPGFNLPVHDAVQRARRIRTELACALAAQGPETTGGRDVAAWAMDDTDPSPSISFFKFSAARCKFGS